METNGAEYIGRIHEGTPPVELKSTHKWIRLLVHRNATADDQKAENLFKRLADLLRGSSYGEYFVLSVFRIDPEEERTSGELPRIETYPPVVGLSAITRYLTSDINEVQAR